MRKDVQMCGYANVQMRMDVGIFGRMDVRLSNDAIGNCHCTNELMNQ